MAELVSGGTGENGALTIKADDGKIAARLFTEGGVTPVVSAGGGMVTAPGGGTGIGVLPGGGGVAITGIAKSPVDVLELGHAGRGATILIRGSSGDTSFRLAGGDVANGVADLTVGGGAHPGRLRLMAPGGKAALGASSDATSVLVEIGGGGRVGFIRLLDGQGRQRIGLDATLGQIYLTNDSGVHTVILDAATGDVSLAGADVAEEFDVADDVEPGSVVRIGEDGRLTRTTSAYDQAAAGVISGQGYRPGVVLDRRPGVDRRLPLAMVGKVLCLADATRAPIRAGSLLASSDRVGHAMAIRDRRRAYGAVIGKALGDLPDGIGLVPMLVGLR